MESPRTFPCRPAPELEGWSLVSKAEHPGMHGGAPHLPGHFCPEHAVYLG